MTAMIPNETANIPIVGITPSVELDMIAIPTNGDAINKYPSSFIMVQIPLFSMTVRC